MSAKRAASKKPHGHYCFSVSTLDYDDDGWPDIYVACDSTPAILYHNNHDGTFTDIAADAGVAFNEDGREQAGMGSTVGDYDGDGHLDIFKTNFSDDTATLYHNNGDGTFADVTFPAGLGINTDSLGWGAMFIDVDNDGWPDLLVVNGHVYPEVDTASSARPTASPASSITISATEIRGHLQRLRPRHAASPRSGRGLAIADLWNDGRQEAVVNNISDYPMLLVNVATNSNHWFGLQTNRKPLQSRRHRRASYSPRRAPHLGRRSPQWLELQLQQRPATPLRPRTGNEDQLHRNPLA